MRGHGESSELADAAIRWGTLNLAVFQSRGREFSLQVTPLSGSSYHK